MSETDLSFLSVPGVRLATIGAGIRYQGRDDLLALELAPGATTAAVFTRNAFCAAPVTLARHHLSQTAPRYLLVNSGNANAGTGARGLDDARACCVALAEAAGSRTIAVARPAASAEPLRRRQRSTPAVVALR